MSLRLGIPIWSNLRTQRRVVSPRMLDTLAPTYGAWSVARQIRTAYNGPLIRVRESGSNSEADINAVNGVLDEASLASHCGANSGYITKIYNQDANETTLDFMQSTTTIQPIAVEYGAVVKENGKPAAKFVAASARRMPVPTSTTLFKFLHDGTACSLSMVAKTNNTGSNKYLLSTQNSSGVQVGFSMYRNSGEAFSVAIANGSGLPVNIVHSTASTNQSILSLAIDADSSPVANREKAWLNGTLATPSNSATAAVSTANASGSLTLGARGDGVSAHDGTIQELIIWPTDETASRAVWEADMADFYGVTLA